MVQGYVLSLNQVDYLGHTLTTDGVSRCQKNSQASVCQEGANFLTFTEEADK